MGFARRKSKRRLVTVLARIAKRCCGRAGAPHVVRQTWRHAV